VIFTKSNGLDVCVLLVHSTFKRQRHFTSLAN
jgi:hypothetical protein